jgi:hypothetical protein
MATEDASGYGRRVGQRQYREPPCPVSPDLVRGTACGRKEHVLLPELQAAVTDEELRQLAACIVALIAQEHTVTSLDATLEAP